MQEEELKVYFATFNECWKFLKKYSDPDNSDEFWEELIEDLERTISHYPNHEFARRMLLETEREIEEIRRRKCL